MELRAGALERRQTSRQETGLELERLGLSMLVLCPCKSGVSFGTGDDRRLLLELGYDNGMRSDYVRYDRGCIRKHTRIKLGIMTKSTYYIYYCGNSV